MMTKIIKNKYQTKNTQKNTKNTKKHIKNKQEINLNNYECECKGKFKQFGKKTLKQYICTQCGQYVTEEKLYKYKKE